MKKLLVVCAVLLLVAAPALADNTVGFGSDNTQQEVGNANNNSGIIGNNNVVGGGAEVGGDVNSTAIAGVANFNSNFGVNANDVDVNNFNSDFNSNINHNDVDVDVDNKNTNFNTNLNSNEQEQGQQQGQSQFQNQGQSQGQNNFQNISPKQNNTQVLKLNQTYNEAQNKRELPNAVGHAYATRGPEFRSEPNVTGNVQSSSAILQVRKTFSLRMLKALERGEDLHVIVKAYRDHREALGYPKSGYKGIPDDLLITIIVAMPDMSQYDDVAHLTVIGEDDTTTMGSIAAAAVEAIRHGSDTLLVTGEGAAKVLEASGWGIMLGGSGSIITSDTNNGAVGAVIAPGIGYASAKTAYGFCPYIQAFGLKTK